VLKVVHVPLEILVQAAEKYFMPDLKVFRVAQISQIHATTLKWLQQVGLQQFQDQELQQIPS
jgi:trimethylamine:corrinoid methyltransferase-like protein